MLVVVKIARFPVIHLISLFVRTQVLASRSLKSLARSVRASRKAKLWLRLSKPLSRINLRAPFLRHMSSINKVIFHRPLNFKLSKTYPSIAAKRRIPSLGSRR